MALRVRGLLWGLPSNDHLFSYHPDEFSIVGNALRMSTTGDLNPHFFNYGSLFIYLVAGMFKVFPPGDSLAMAHFMARFLSAVLGLASVVLVYRMGRDLFGQWAGMAAAAVLGFAPLAVVHSHFATVDAAATFFVVASASLSAPLLRRCDRWRYPAAGALAGLSAATKYFGILALAWVFWAHLERERWRTRSLLRPILWSAPLAAVGAFLVACPYSLLDWGKFSHDVAFELTHKAAGAATYTYGLPGFAFLAAMAWPTAVGWPLAILSAVALLARRTWREPAGRWVAVGLLVFAVPIAIGREIFVRYAFVLIPFAGLLVGALVGHPSASRAGTETRPYRTGGRGDPPLPYYPAFVITILGLAMVYTLLHSSAYVAMMDQPDVRDRAAAWLRPRLTNDASVGLKTRPWFYTPPLVPDNGGPLSGDAALQTASQRGFRLVVTGFDTSKLERERPQWFVISEFEFHNELARGDPDARRFFKALAADYRLAARFTASPTVLGIRFPDSHLHDWRYINPEILIYRRR